MADVALILHVSLEAMDRMGLGELMGWRARAAARAAAEG